MPLLKDGRQNSLVIILDPNKVKPIDEIMNKEARMPIPSSDEGDGKGESSNTLSEFIFRFPDPAVAAELEQFRIRYELRFGETDLTKRYTSTWPADSQQWLITHYPERYWKGLPTFVQAFIKHKMTIAKANGKLDDMPGNLLGLFLSGKMDVGGGPSL